MNRSLMFQIAILDKKLSIVAHIFDIPIKV